MRTFSLTRKDANAVLIIYHLLQLKGETICSTCFCRVVEFAQRQGATRELILNVIEVCVYLNYFKCCYFCGYIHAVSEQALQNLHYTAFHYN